MRPVAKAITEAVAILERERGDIVSIRVTERTYRALLDELGGRAIVRWPESIELEMPSGLLKVELV